MRWCKWKRLGLPKDEGGLGFKDLELFNDALLAKQTWRMIRNPDCLMSKLLKQRYFPETDILNAKISTKSCYIWKSIIVGRDLIKKGIRYNIGDGENVSFTNDNWLPLNPPRPPRMLNQAPINSKVSEWFDTTKTYWNESKLRDQVEVEDAEIILSMKLCIRGNKDMLGWHYNRNGQYSVKSGYWVASHDSTRVMISAPGGNSNLKKAVWKLNIPTKIKHFIWNVLAKTISIGSNLVRRHITSDGICKRCYTEEETESHLFFNCPYAQAIWRASGIPSLRIMDQNESFMVKLEECFNFNTNHQLLHFRNLPLWILWRIWKSRNMLLYQNRDDSWTSCLQYAIRDSNEWFAMNQGTIADLNNRNTTRVSGRSIWEKPDQDWMKCNVDGSFISNKFIATAGWVYRDSTGTFRGAVQATGIRTRNSLESELQALIMAMQHSWIRGYRRIVFETDSQQLLSIIQGRDQVFSMQNWIVELNRWRSKFNDIRFCWTKRENNIPANLLAKLQSSSTVSFAVFDSIPSFLYFALCKDNGIPSS